MNPYKKFSQNNNNDVTQLWSAKSEIQKVIKFLVKEVNTNKLNYDQMRYIFKIVRERCEIEIPRPKQALIELPTKEELQKFYSSIKDPIHILLFQTLEGTGLRVAELTSLEVKRIDFDLNTVFVSEGKGGKDRLTVVGNKLKEKLLIYLSGRKNKYLFESNRGTRFSTRRIEQICKKYKDKASIEKDLTPHTFRHIWNTKMAEAGITEEKRAILAGHSKNSNIQKVYTHLTLGGIKEEVLLLLDKN